MNKLIYPLLTFAISQSVFAEDKPHDLGIMNIVGVSPLGGSIEADKLPTPVQTVNKVSTQDFFLPLPVNSLATSGHISSSSQETNALEPFAVSEYCHRSS